MNDKRAQEILRCLASGTDPFTGAELATGTVLQNVDVVRALIAGADALEERTVRASRRAQLPKNIGKTWSPEEHERLVKAFQKGETPAQIAIKHSRTVRSIEARLELHGLITAAQRTTSDRFGPTQSGGSKPGAPRKRGPKRRTT